MWSCLLERKLHCTLQVQSAKQTVKSLQSSNVSFVCPHLGSVFSPLSQKYCCSLFVCQSNVTSYISIIAGAFAGEQRLVRNASLNHVLVIMGVHGGVGLKIQEPPPSFIPLHGSNVSRPLIDRGGVTFSSASFTSQRHLFALLRAVTPITFAKYYILTT